MAENELSKELESGLDDALKAMEEIQRRIEGGEEIDEKELLMLSRLVATRIEHVRMALEAAVGPIDPEVIKRQMKERLSPEEYQEWLITEEQRKTFREQVRQEKDIRNQLGA
jgi:hypothetical protein